MAAVPSLESSHCEAETDRDPLLMERLANRNSAEHVIDMARGGGATASVSDGPGEEFASHAPVAQLPSASLSPLAASSSRNGSFGRRSENYGRRNRSPLNSGLWISVELAVNVCQIVAAITVLCLSKNENPQAPLFEWIVGYTAGCFATLPHLYWRYVHRNRQSGQQESALARQGSSQNPPEPGPYTAVSVTPAPDDHNSTTAAGTQSGQIPRTFSPRLIALVDHFKMALDCFFAVWFVVGNVWVFGGHSSAAEAPNMYRLCIVFLTFSCVGYAMPFILCGMICCCLPCIISIMGFREDSGQNRGAATELINALPTYKFKLKRNRNREESGSESQGDGGILGVGTDKERTISAEDAACCICLANYGDGEELRELPCTHFFHMECVDKWLKINALCPLCKAELGNTGDTASGANPDRSDGRVGSGTESQ